MEDILKIFHASSVNIPEEMSATLKSHMTDEVLTNVFNNTKRNELCLNEQDILSHFRKSDRGFSIDETPENEEEEQKELTPSELEFMRLKKTTVLTGNHTGVKRDRA